MDSNATEVRVASAVAYAYGPAFGVFSVTVPGEPTRYVTVSLGERETRNTAAFKAVIAALRWIGAETDQRWRVVTDSRMVVKALLKPDHFSAQGQLQVVVDEVLGLWNDLRARAWITIEATEDPLPERLDQMLDERLAEVPRDYHAGPVATLVDYLREVTGRRAEHVEGPVFRLGEDTVLVTPYFTPAGDRLVPTSDMVSYGRAAAAGAKWILWRPYGARLESFTPRAVGWGEFHADMDGNVPILCSHVEDVTVTVDEGGKRGGNGAPVVLLRGEGWFPAVERFL